MTEKHYPLDDSPHFQMIELDETTSTNDFLKRYCPLQERRLTLVTAEFQTAGRGSGQNQWESERGKNLVFSLMVHPRHILPDRIFLMSEVMALAVSEALDSQLSDFNSQMSIKWPNDIYFGNCKLCGMLIENEIQASRVERCILGVGINVNQAEFLGPAPNPISLAQIMGHKVERRFVLERIIERFSYYYGLTERGEGKAIHTLYLSHLYRRDEQHAFRDEKGCFRGTITDVEPSGRLIITDEVGNDRHYAFKEVEYVIES